MVEILRMIWKTSMWTQLQDFFMSVTLQAAVHLGQDYTGHLRSIKNQPFKSVRQLFQTTERLITDQMEITGLSTIDWKQPMWRETTLLCDRAVQIANSKTYVFSDSVLCLGNISVKPVESWEDRIKWFLETRYLKDLDRIDGDPMEFEGTFFPGFTTLGILAEIQKIMTESKCEPEQVKGRIIFLSMYTDIVWRQRGNRGNCVAKTFNVAAYANKFTRSDGGQFWDLIVRKIGMELSNRVAESMMINFAESGHPMFQATSAFGKRRDEKWRRWKENHSQQRKWRNRWIDSSHCYFGQSAQYLRSSRRFVQQIGESLC